MTCQLQLVLLVGNLQKSVEGKCWVFYLSSALFLEGHITAPVIFIFSNYLSLSILLARFLP